jgi:hypothetical protein
LKCDLKETQAGKCISPSDEEEEKEMEALIVESQRLQSEIESCAFLKAPLGQQPQQQHSPSAIVATAESRKRSALVLAQVKSISTLVEGDPHIRKPTAAAAALALAPGVSGIPVSDTKRIQLQLQQSPASAAAAASIKKRNAKSAQEQELENSANAAAAAAATEIGLDDVRVVAGTGDHAMLSKLGITSERLHEMTVAMHRQLRPPVEAPPSSWKEYAAQLSIHLADPPNSIIDAILSHLPPVTTATAPVGDIRSVPLVGTELYTVSYLEEIARTPYPIVPSAASGSSERLPSCARGGNCCAHLIRRPPDCVRLEPLHAFVRRDELAYFRKHGHLLDNAPRLCVLCVMLEVASVANMVKFADQVLPVNMMIQPFEVKVDCVDGFNSEMCLNRGAKWDGIVAPFPRCLPNQLSLERAPDGRGYYVSFRNMQWRGSLAPRAAQQIESGFC